MYRTLHSNGQCVFTPHASSAARSPFHEAISRVTLFHSLVAGELLNGYVTAWLPASLLTTTLTVQLALWRVACHRRQIKSDKSMRSLVLIHIKSRLSNR